MRNAFTILLTSRGVPLLLSGDEFANTQYGNNNAYCQDNEISYLDWERLQTHRELHLFVRNLIAFRKAHPVLRSASYDFGHNETGYPELSFHGTTPWHLNESEPNLTFAYLYTEEREKYQMEKTSFIYVLVNAHWEDHVFRLPIIPAGMQWYLSCDSSGISAAPGEEQALNTFESYLLTARSTAVLPAR